MTRSRLDPVLADLRRELLPRVEEWSRASKNAVNPLQGRMFADAGQWELCRRVLQAIGFDFERGRMDRSTHPFTAQSGIHDVRLTVRIRPDDLPSAILTALHEGGHGLYDQGFMPTDRDSFLAESPGMGLHESQSRLWENHVGRSRAFWRRWFPAIQALFPDASRGLCGDDFFRSVNLVSRGTSRVNSDEVSYHLHILLRYELELAMLDGQLTANDLPAAWNDRMKELLGVIPASDREGVLQDSHWSMGAFGYFPSYTIGSLYAAQLAESFQRAHGLDGEIDGADFEHLLIWLRTNIHHHGHRESAEDLMRNATGTGLDSSAYLRHIDRVRRSVAEIHA